MADTKRKIRVGRTGEEAAARYLAAKGLTVVARNWRGPEGEIDIIVADGETIAFVEVRSRTGGTFDHVGELFPMTKRRRMMAAAAHYPIESPDIPLRYDLVFVDYTAGSARITHISGAFGEDGV